MMPDSRTASFGLGISGDPENAVSSMSAKFNAQVPKAFTPKSILQQYMPSPNGMSQRDAQRMTPSGVLPSPNGVAADTYNKQNPTNFAYRLQI